MYRLISTASTMGDTYLADMLPSWLLLPR